MPSTERGSKMCSILKILPERFMNRSQFVMLAVMLCQALPPLANADTLAGSEGGGSAQLGAGQAAGQSTDQAAADKAAWEARRQAQLAETRALHELNPDPIKTCMAAQPAPPAKKRGPVRKVIRAVGKELAYDSVNFMKDAIFVFSAQDIDPYAVKKPTNKPYEAFELRMTDGSTAQVIQYPDRSSILQGGYMDGTIVAPYSGGFVIAYPNGSRARMVKEGQDIKIFRPDMTVTTFKKGMSGRYDVVNDKMGFLGTAAPDSQYDDN